jgi:hypothetical protein
MFQHVPIPTRKHTQKIMANKMNVGKLDDKWRLQQNITITIVMQVICSYRVREDLREIKKIGILLASCRNYEDCRLQADVRCYQKSR